MFIWTLRNQPQVEFCLSFCKDTRRENIITLIFSIYIEKQTLLSTSKTAQDSPFHRDDLLCCYPYHKAARHWIFPRGQGVHISVCALSSVWRSLGHSAAPVLPLVTGAPLQVSLGSSKTIKVLKKINSKWKFFCVPFETKVCGITFTFSQKVNLIFE